MTPNRESGPAPRRFPPRSRAPRSSESAFLAPAQAPPHVAHRAGGDRRQVRARRSLAPPTRPDRPGQPTSMSHLFLSSRDSRQLPLEDRELELVPARGHGPHVLELLSRRRGLFEQSIWPSVPSRAAPGPWIAHQTRYFVRSLGSGASWRPAVVCAGPSGASQLVPPLLFPLPQAASPGASCSSRGATPSRICPSTSRLPRTTGARSPAPALLALHFRFSRPSLSRPPPLRRPAPAGSASRPAGASSPASPSSSRTRRVRARSPLSEPTATLPRRHWRLQVARALHLSGFSPPAGGAPLVKVTQHQFDAREDDWRAPQPPLPLSPAPFPAPSSRASRPEPPVSQPNGTQGLHPAP